MKVTGSVLWKPVQCGSKEKCCCGELEDSIFEEMETFEKLLEFAICVEIHIKEEFARNWFKF